MVTAIDVGNSAIKVARVVDGVVTGISRMPTSAHPDTTALLAAIDATTDDVALVSVVPRWTATIRALVSDRGRSLMNAHAGSIPIAVSLPHPGRVGADRLLGAWTAREAYGAPVIVVDCGTATTIDVVDSTGSFVGGAILPGVELAIRSLAADTAVLPPVPARFPGHAIGRDTVEAIQSGTVLGHAAAIAGLLARMIEELDSETRPTVVLTGGGSATLGSIGGVDRVDDDLLLRGLGLLAGRLAVAR